MTKNPLATTALTHSRIVSAAESAGKLIASARIAKSAARGRKIASAAESATNPNVNAKRKTKMELPIETKRTKSKALPSLRARYALALIDAGHETVITLHDQKRLLALRLVTMDADGSLALSVSGCKKLHSTKEG